MRHFPNPIWGWSADDADGTVKKEQAASSGEICGYTFQKHNPAEQRERRLRNDLALTRHIGETRWQPVRNGWGDYLLDRLRGFFEMPLHAQPDHAYAE